MNKVTTNDQVKHLIQLRKSLKRGKAGNLAENAALVDFLVFDQQMSAELKKTWEIIKERMSEHSITKIDGQGFVLGFTKPVDSFKIVGKVDTKLTKPVLDTDKVKAYMVLNNKLPKNVINDPYPKFYKKISLGA